MQERLNKVNFVLEWKEGRTPGRSVIFMSYHNEREKKLRIHLQPLVLVLLSDALPPSKGGIPDNSGHIKSRFFNMLPDEIEHMHCNATFLS